MSHQLTVKDFEDFTIDISIASSTQDDKSLICHYSPTNNKGIFSCLKQNQRKGITENFNQAISIYNNL